MVIAVFLAKEVVVPADIKVLVGEVLLENFLDQAVRHATVKVAKVVAVVA